MVEEEAHTANLTQRIKVLLNVQEPGSQDAFPPTQTQNGQLEEVQSSIQEVEEELEEEVKKGEKV
jgi:hypothetical protein